jgi:hypothetical protein
MMASAIMNYPDSLPNSHGHQTRQGQTSISAAAHRDTGIDHDGQKQYDENVSE